MTIESTLQQAAEDILKTFADGANNATYYPVTGDPISCVVHLDREAQNEPDGLALQANTTQVTIEGLLHELGGKPDVRRQNQPGGKFVISSQTWEVTGIIEADEIFFTCSVEEVE